MSLCFLDRHIIHSQNWSRMKKKLWLLLYHDDFNIFVNWMILNYLSLFCYNHIYLKVSLLFLRITERGRLPQISWNFYQKENRPLSVILTASWGWSTIIKVVKNKKGTLICRFRINYLIQHLKSTDWPIITLLLFCSSNTHNKYSKLTQHII